MNDRQQSCNSRFDCIENKIIPFIKTLFEISAAGNFVENGGQKIIPFIKTLFEISAAGNFVENEGQKSFFQSFRQHNTIF